MIYSELITLKSKASKMAIRLLSINVFLYTGIMLINVLPNISNKIVFILLFLPVFFLIPILSLISTYPKAYKDRKNREKTINTSYGDAEIHDHYPVNLPSSHKLSLFQKKIYFIGLIFIAFLIPFIMYDLIFSNSLYVAIMALISGTSIAYAVFLYFRYINYDLIFTDSHMIYNFAYAIPYASKFKYQFIKLKKAGYIIEMNTGSTYMKIFVSKDQKSMIENRFSSYSLARNPRTNV